MASQNFGSILGLPPGFPGGGVTRVVPGSGTGGRTDMSGLRRVGGRITPSIRPSWSLRLSPERVEPVERGSWRGSGGVLLSGVGSLGTGS